MRARGVRPSLLSCETRILKLACTQQIPHAPRKVIFFRRFRSRGRPARETYDDCEEVASSASGGRLFERRESCRSRDRSRRATLTQRCCWSPHC